MPKEDIQVIQGCKWELYVPQDVDSAYLVKADLEDKVGALTDEINFLRTIYDEVTQTHIPNYSHLGAIYTEHVLDGFKHMLDGCL